ncbi:sex peptide receptor-like [Lineus longissimus]|uniref:sex peptide receptor-like n=1 Tax=Lineus longissimus TaxID=88925 RepID=UPI00315CB506
MDKLFHFVFTTVTQKATPTMADLSGAGVISTQLPGSELTCSHSKVYADVFYLYMYAITPVAMSGIVLNVINLIVLRHMQKKATTSVFLLRMLAGCDLFFLIICIVYFFVRPMFVYLRNSIEVFSLSDDKIASAISFLMEPFYYSSLQARNWMIVLVTFERFLNIVFPLWARGHCTKGNLGKAAVCIFLVALAFALPGYYHKYLVNGKNPCTGAVELQSRLRQESKPFRNTTYVVVTVFVPMCLIYTMNIILVISVRNAMRSRQSTTDKERMRDERGQTQATLTVISIVVLFTVCETLPGLDRVIVLFSGAPFARDSPFFNYVRKSGLFLIVFDSAMNFVAYCFSNRSFRQSFVVMFRMAQP